MSRKTGWTRVAFGDVVRQVRDRVDPEESGLERYVAGEHMDTDDLRIRRWGTIGDGYLGPAFHMRFNPGQVLYGSRRTYLRKVAVADFEGITANTTFVLEPKDPCVLLPELLPFVMQTEAFHQHAIKQSKGSVNPYINFSDLTWFEFLLPPPDEQRRITTILNRARESVDSLVRLEEAYERVIASAAAHEFDQLSSTRVPVVTLGSLCSRGPQSGIYKSEEFRGAGVRLVNMGELFGNDTIHSGVETQRISVTDSELQRYALTPHDLLFGRRSVVLEGAGKCVRVGELIEPTVFESSVLRVTIDSEQADPGYVFEWFRSPSGHQQIKRIVTFTTVSGVAGSSVARLPVPLPPLNKQNEIAERLCGVRRMSDALRRRATSGRELSMLAARTLL